MNHILLSSKQWHSGSRSTWVSLSRRNLFKRNSRRSLIQMKKSTFWDEVVEDSEPEREAQRQKEREERKKKRKATATVAPVTVIDISDDEGNGASSQKHSVIEISDASVSGISTSSSPVLNVPIESVPPSALALPVSTGDLSDATSHISVISRPKSVESELESQDEALYESAQPVDSSDGPVAHVLLGVPLLDDSGFLHDSLEEGVVGMDIARFAYTAARPHNKMLQFRAGPSLPVSRSSSLGLEVKAQTKNARGTSHRFADEFPDAGLAKLLKCVSCDIRWTARKTAAQKMMHVQSCAKKNALTDETVRVLIRKEIDNAAPEDVGTKGKGKAKISPGLLSEALPLKTFFDDVVQEATPKKRGKRREIIETVKNIAETRTDILGRAQDILGPTRSAESDADLVIGTQAFGQSRLRNIFAEVVPPTTQAFGKSAVAQRQGSKPTLFPNGDSFADEFDVLPATQNFAPSRLGAAVHRLVVEAETYDWGQVPSPTALAVRDGPTHSPNTGTNLYPSPSAFTRGPNTSVNDLSPTSSSTRIKGAPVTAPINEANENAAVDISTGQHDDIAWNSDDALLHFDPNDKLGSPLRMSAKSKGEENGTPNVAKPKKSAKPRNTNKNSDSSGSDISLRARRETSKKTKLKAKQREPRQSEDEYNEEWERDVKTKIESDEKLYLRILRYEPIHFDAFLKLVADDPPYSGKLKYKLRSFLDKQAINFYGGEAPGRGRR